MRYFILSTFFWLLLLTAFGQKEQSPKDLFLDAEYYRMYEEYEEALPLYQRLINKGKNNAHINYRIGECYLNIPGNKEKAIPYLKKSVDGISRNFKEGSFNEKNAPFYAEFYLGKAYQVDEQIDKALDQYETFINRLEDKDKYNMSFVNKQIESCKTAKRLMQNPIQINKKNLGKEINSQHPNNRPVLNSDESKIIYNSRLKFYDAVFMAEKDSTGKWKPSKNMTPQLQSEGDFYPSSINNKGNKLFLFKSNPYNGDIYVSNYNKEKEKWEKPEKLGKNINSKFWETHACICNNGKTMYFTSNRKEGMGGLDIYYSNYNEQEGKWGPAKNLGSKINTPYNEETPFLTEDGQRLYFSSQGHEGMGGFDIFYVKKISENEWSEPVNIGYPINTTGDDLFFYPVNNGHAGYIARHDKDGFGKQDIIRIEIYSPENPKQVNLKGKINVPEKKIQNGKIFVKIDSVNGKTLKKQTFPKRSKSFNFSHTLTPGNYTVNIEGDDYLTIKKHISIARDYSRDTFELSAKLIPKEEKIAPFTTLKNVYFNYDSDRLTTESKKYLNRLVKIMVKHPELNVEVIGHTDAKGTAQYNKNLSEERARSVTNYLQKKGTSGHRITKKGKGEKYPIALNTYQDGRDCPEGRNYNRRVEFKPHSSRDKSIISQYSVVPDQLKIRENISYYFLIAKKEEQLSKDFFTKFNSKSYKSFGHP